MEARKLGSSDMHITPVGLGTLIDTHEQPALGAERNIHRALDLGVNWIDTAPHFGLGRAEAVVGQALKHWPGQRPLVFTRSGLVVGGRELGDSGVIRPESPDTIRRACEDTLRRLGTDAIDLYQIDLPVGMEPGWEEAAWRTLSALQREGKVRCIGIMDGGVTPGVALRQLRKAREIGPVAAVQAPFLPLDEDARRELPPYCEASGIGVLVYMPMGRGLLAGRLSREAGTVLGTGGMVRERMVNACYDPEDSRFRAPLRWRNTTMAEEFRRIGRARGCSIGEVAIAWTLRLPAVTGVIASPQVPDDVEAVARGAGLQLDDTEIARLEALWADESSRRPWHPGT